jgi:hypothetical protein
MINVGKSIKMPVVRCDCCHRVVSVKNWAVLEYLIKRNNETICGDCEVTQFIA